MGGCGPWVSVVHGWARSMDGCGEWVGVTHRRMWSMVGVVHGWAWSMGGRGPWVVWSMGGVAQHLYIVKNLVLTCE